VSYLVQQKKKLLYVGVCYKYCAVCSIRNKLPTPQYRCFKNCGGSSTFREANIIAAGYKESESMHGLQCTGDGDSSVLHTVQTIVPYGRDGNKAERADLAQIYNGRCPPHLSFMHY